ncbi:MAG: formate dehydrogenase [Proteobacteria bacterium]|nr:formate dehydrogenase [Pseudomonadota bacterium]
MKASIFRVEKGDPLETLRGFLRRVLESKLVDAILVPKAHPTGSGYVQTLIKDPEMLGDAHPLAPTMPVQSGRIASHLTLGQPGGRIGAVIKSCELRAVVELAKFLQVESEHLITIGVDCLGTYEVKDYARIVEGKGGGDVVTEGLLKGAKKGQIESQEGMDLRLACRICEYPVPLNADITVGLFGHDPTKEIEVIIGDRIEADVEQSGILELSPIQPSDREKVVAELIEQRTQQRDQVFHEFKEKVTDLQALANTLSTCIRCHNCMVACPICYCKECVFRTPTFEHQSDQFLRWAGRKGGIQMPTDTLIFHLTRMAHMATSCVGCGLCDSACPNELPVTTLFRTVGHGVQALFDYVPGRNPDENPPVATFREDELQIETGAKD